MFRFLSTRANLRNPDLWGGDTRMHTLDSGEVVPATSKFVLLHLRFHHFHRATDRDFHNHQFEFWTFPLQTYLEEALRPRRHGGWERFYRVIHAGLWTYKEPSEPHRIIGPCTSVGSLLDWDTHHIRTVIWRGRVDAPGRTGFYLPTDEPHVFDFLTFEQYAAWQKHEDQEKQRAAAAGDPHTPTSARAWLEGATWQGRV